MKQFKSDGRYKYHNQGFQYIVEFRWANCDDQELFIKLRLVFTDMYGKEKEKIYDHNPVLGRWVMNEHWRLEVNRSAKRRRIYLKDDSALSLALLRV